MEVKRRHTAVRQCVLGGLHARAAFGVLFRGAQGRGHVAGNGKTMAEKTEKSTVKRAKGKSTNGKSGRRKSASADARAKRPARRKKAPAAETARKQQAAGETLQPAGGSAAAQPVDGERLGVDRLTDAVDQLLNKEKSKQIATSLADQVAQGNASSARVLIMLADRKKRSSDLNAEKAEMTNLLLNLANQPEYEEPAEDDCEAKEETGGVLETVHAVAEN